MTIKQRLYDGFILIGLTAAILALILFPSVSVNAAKDGLSLAFGVVLPSLFPFFVITSLMIKTGIVEKIGKLFVPASKLMFNSNSAGSAAFVMGILGGYPLGAKSICELYKNELCTKTEAEHLLSYCCNSGPAFILGACGAGVFQNMTAGFVLLISHILAACAVGIIFRPFSKNSASKIKPKSSNTNSFPTEFVKAVKESFGSILDVCAFVIFFAVIMALLNATGIIPHGQIGTLIKGFTELTGGIFELSGVSLKTALPIASFFIGWGGLCVHCQAMSFILPLKLKMWKYFVGKLLHGLISALFTIFIYSLLF